MNYCYENPGNISVYKLLINLKGNNDLILNPKILINGTTEDIFKAQYPEFNKEGGWLWIIYKNMCNYNINETIFFLENLYKVK
jgi:hypothetical protein